MGKSLQARAKKSTDQKIGSFIAVICLVVLYVFLFLLDNALPSNSTTIMLVTVLKKGAIYALVCVSMNLLNGFTGLFSLGQAGFMLIGAYAYSIFRSPQTSTPPCISTLTAVPSNSRFRNPWAMSWG